MNFDLEVKGNVITKLHHAYIWHEEKRKGTGEKLRKDIDECYRKLVNNPYIRRKRNKLYRRIYLIDFPYYFVYGINRNKITIILFKHKSQR